MYPKQGSGEWPPNVWGSILHFVSDVIDFFAHHLGGSYGISILIVTILVRLIILPLFIRQLRYQRMMMELQPEMQKIRSKYKGDNQKIQQETMKLYQEAGTNPVAGCLPTLIQLPVLYALYGAIIGNKGIHQSIFLGVFDLGQHDPHFILPIIAGLTTFLSSYLTMRNQPAQQRAILFIMPLFIIFIGARLPAGLVLYWIYTNLFTALQTYVFMTRPMKKAKLAGAGAPVTVTVPEKPAKPQMSGGPAKSRSEGKSSSQRRSSGNRTGSGSSNANNRNASNRGSGSSANRARRRANQQSTQKPPTAVEKAPQSDSQNNPSTDGRSDD